MSQDVPELRRPAGCLAGTCALTDATCALRSPLPNPAATWGPRTADHLPLHDAAPHTGGGERADGTWSHVTTGVRSCLSAN